MAVTVAVAAAAAARVGRRGLQHVGEKFRPAFGAVLVQNGTSELAHKVPDLKRVGIKKKKEFNNYFFALTYRAIINRRKARPGWRLPE